MDKPTKIQHRPIDEAGETQPKNESEINIIMFSPKKKKRDYEKSIHLRTKQFAMNSLKKSSKGANKRRLRTQKQTSFQPDGGPTKSIEIVQKNVSVFAYFF